MYNERFVTRKKNHYPKLRVQPFGCRILEKYSRLHLKISDYLKRSKGPDCLFIGAVKARHEALTCSTSV
jgi:hypothetical protein